MDAALLKRAQSAIARARNVLEADVDKRGIWGSPAGKAKVARRIADLLPAHKTYVEPFVGSGAVLFVKQQADREIINDADADIIKAFRIIKALSDVDIDRLEKMDWVGSRKRYDALVKSSPTGKLDWLHKFLYESRFSYRKIRGSGYDSTAEGVEAGLMKRLRDRAGRLKNVEIHSGDYGSVVRKFDSPATVFFFDPPYMGGYESQRSLFRGDPDVKRQKFDEREFFKVLQGIKGKFVLTYGLKGELPKLIQSESKFKARKFQISGSTNKPVDLLVTNFEPTRKKLSDKQRAEVDAETVKIRENAKRLENQKPHDFKAAEWTHANGHPRCIHCGDEESISGRCNDTKADEAASKTDPKILKIQIPIEPGDDRLSKAVRRLAGVVGIRTEASSNHAVIVVPDAAAIADGKADLLIDTKKNHPISTRVLIGDGEAHAFVKLGKPERIDLWKFAELADRHCLTDEQRKAAWPNARRLWAYSIDEAEQTDPSMVEIGLTNDDAEAFADAHRLAKHWSGLIGSFASRQSKFVDSSQVGFVETLPAIANELHAALKQVAADDVEPIESDASAVVVGHDLLQALQQIDPRLPKSRTKSVVARAVGALIDLDQLIVSSEPDRVDDESMPADALEKGIVVHNDTLVEIESRETATSVAKRGDPLMDLPSQRGPRPAAFQFRFCGDELRGDLRIQINDTLVGWQVANQIVDKAACVSEIREAKRFARRFDRDGNFFLRKWTAPDSLISSPRPAQTKAWLDIDAERFEAGEIGAGQNTPGVIVRATSKGLGAEFGLQSSHAHEYFFTGDPKFDGRLCVRKIDTENGPVWRSFWSDRLLPSVLDRQSVTRKIMPPDGYSAIPVSLEEVIPDGLRFWTAKGAEAREVRDALIGAELFTVDNIRIVDGAFRRVLTKMFVDLGESRTANTLTRYSVTRQLWKSHQSKQSSREAWRLAIQDDGGLMVFDLQADPLSESRLAGVMRTTKSDDLLTFDGEVEPGQSIDGEILNRTKSMQSEIHRTDRGTIDFIERSDDSIRLVFKGKMRGEYTLTREEPGSDIWLLRRDGAHAEPTNGDKASLFAKREDGPAYVSCPPCGSINLRFGGVRKTDSGDRVSVVDCNDCGAQFGVDVTVIKRVDIDDDFQAAAAEHDDAGSYELFKAVSVRDGVQLWDDIRKVDADRSQLRPFAIYEPMTERNELATVDDAFDFATPTLLQMGIVVEPLFSGDRLSMQKRGNRVMVYSQETTTIQTLIFSKERFDRAQATQWAKDHDRRADKIDETENSFRLRQREPGEFKDGSLRTITLTDGVKAVIGRLKSAKGDLSKQLPGLVKSLRSINGDFVLDGMCAKPVDDASKIAIVDALFVPSAGNILTKSQSERRRKAEQLIRTAKLDRLSMAPLQIVRSQPELRDAIDWAARQPGSVGASMKGVESTYGIGDKAELWATIKIAAAAPDASIDLMRMAMGKRIPLLKTEEERFALGIVLEPNDGDGKGIPLDPDTQDDIYSAEEVRAAAHKFMQEFRNTGVMHTELANDRIKILESYIAPSELTVSGTKIRQGTWLMAVRVVDDALWSKVKRGELTGFSIGGSALRSPEPEAAA